MLALCFEAPTAEKRIWLNIALNKSWDHFWTIRCWRWDRAYSLTITVKLFLSVSLSIKYMDARSIAITMRNRDTLSHEPSRVPIKLLIYKYYMCGVRDTQEHYSGRAREPYSRQARARRARWGKKLYRAVSLVPVKYFPANVQAHARQKMRVRSHNREIWCKYG